MENVDNESLILKQRRLFDWLLRAFAATSFAMILFYADKRAELSSSDGYAFCCFLVASIFACAGLLISGKAQVHGTELTSTVDSRHSLSFIFSLLCFVIGLVLFLHSVSQIFMATFALAGIAAVFICEGAGKPRENS